MINDDCTAESTTRMELTVWWNVLLTEPTEHLDSGEYKRDGMDEVDGDARIPVSLHDSAQKELLKGTVA